MDSTAGGSRYETEGGSGSDSNLTETERKRRYLINANKKLRVGVKHLSERQEILEELIDLEFNQTGFYRFLANKKLFMYVLGYTDKDVGDASTKNENYKRLIRLMRVTNEYWKFQRANFAKPKSKHQDMVRRYEEARPQELKDLDIIVDYDNGVIGRNPATKCRKCFDTTHGTKSCPYKKAVNRSPAVAAQIKERMEQWKKVEGYDPLIPKSYKRKQYKMKRHELKGLRGFDILDGNEEEDEEGEGTDDST